MLGGDRGILDLILGLIVLLISIVIHENAHGVVALWLGDDTAKKSGRLTLNPVKHLDLVGSFIIPAAMYFTAGTMFGYAKPVPVSPSKLKGTDRAGFAAVAAAGPISNFILASMAVLVIRALGGLPSGIGGTLLEYAVVWNVTLAAFNLLPIPPLDGSRFLRLFLNPKGRQTLDRVEPYGFLILFAMIYFLEEPLFRVVGFLQDIIIRLLPG